MVLILLHLLKIENMKTKNNYMPRLNKVRMSKIKSIDQSIILLGVHKISPILVGNKEY